MPFFSAEQIEYLLVSPGEEFKPVSETLQHFHHPHTLNLRHLGQLCDSIVCAGCESKIEGPTYCCEECKYYLHKSCAELPLQAQLPLIHPQHPLTLTVMPEGYYLGMRKCRPLCYSCAPCRMQCHLDTVLSIMPCEENDFSEVQSFAHEHPLRCFLMKTKKDRDDCNGCGEIATGEVYGCVGCRFYLHERCFQLLREIRHPHHPNHPLKPVAGNRYKNCGLCSYPFNLGYRCEECSFYIDMRCADMTLSFEDYMKEQKGSATIRHCTHEHELTKFSVESLGERLLCKVCDEKVGREVYGCRDCLFFLHDGCAKLPPEIRHDLHPEHTLTLGQYPNMKSDNLCDCCNSALLYGFVYKCANCSFDLHIKCTLQTLSFIEQGLPTKIEHRFFDSAMKLSCSSRKTFCDVCGEVIKGPAYTYKNTDRMRHVLHKSCAELPLELQRPFHPHPMLAIRTRSLNLLGKFQCNGCMGTKLQGIGFYCRDCEFYLCVTCISQKLTLKHHLHEHSLAYFQETERLKCNLCHKSCNADLYRCVPCNFNLHNDCLPLPRAVKCRHHWDPLILHDSIIEDDSGEYYCDICEQRRNPDHGAYDCAQCNMITDIRCVLPMINLTLSDNPVLIEVNKRITDLKAELEEIEARRMDIIMKLEASEKLKASLSC